MPPVLIDVTRLVGRAIKSRLPTGVDRVMLEYVRHYGANARAVLHIRDRFRALSAAGSQRLFRQLLEQSNRSPERFTRQCVGLLLRELAAGAGAGDFRGCLLLNLGHGNLHRASHQRTLAGHGIKLVYFIHDLIPITHPEYCRPGEKDRHILRINNALRHGAGLIVNSQATLDELGRYADRSGNKLPPAVTALLAPAEMPDPSTTRPLADPYFVMLGTIEGRKNHWMALQVWRKLVEQHGVQAPKLVIIGQRGWECEQVLDLLERCEALQSHVIELGTCRDSEVATWLRHAQALIFPSFAEGYGMPLVEALQLGTPVLASDLPAFREIAGDIPEYLDPLDGPGWQACIERYMEADSAERTAHLRRAARFVAPGWSQHFDIVDSFLESLA